MEASIDEGMDERHAEYATAAVSALEDMRGLARDAGKFAAKGGLPVEFQSETARLRMEIEALEARMSEYAVEVSA